MQSLQAFVAREHVHPLEPFAGGTACVVVPTLARLALTGALGTALPFATYFPAVLIATLFWGLRWGTIVLAASGLIAGLLFVQTSRIALYDSKGLAALGLFFISSAVILFTGQALRQALVSLQAARRADAARKAELQHRLKNTLAIVQSFSFYLSRKTADPVDFHRQLEARISALATASEVLFAESFEVCALPETAEAALAPFSQDARISLEGPPVLLDPDCCEPLILALHELATNAHKYGALSVDEGNVGLSWSIVGPGRSKCAIRWIEKGGPLVHAPVRSGLGQRLLARQRGLEKVTVSYEPAGLSCEIVVPVISVGPKSR